MKPWAVYRRLFGYLKPHSLTLGLVLCAAVFSTAFVVLAPFVVGQVTTTLLESLQKGIFLWPKILGLLALLVILYGVSQLFAFGQGLGMAKVTAHVMETLRREVNEKMHRLQLNYYDTHTHGDILSVMTNDVDLIHQALSQNLTSIVTQLTTALGVLMMLLWIHPLLALIPILMVPLSLISGAGWIKASGTYYKEQQALLGELNGYVEEIYTNHVVVQTFNHQKQAQNRLAMLNEALKKSTQKAEMTAGAVGPITTLVNHLGYVLCAVLGCLMALEGRMTVGNVQAILEYTWRFADPFSTIAGMAGSFSGAAAAGARLFNLLDGPEECPDPNPSECPREGRGHITFQNVTFGYTQERLLMKGIHLDIQPGEKVAVVGPTGAGKTTLVNLLLRFYEVTGGKILVDGVDIQRMARGDLRRRFGVVLQDTWLFEGTIRENIGYAESNMPQERILQGAKAAHAHPFIQTLPGGYDMVLSQGAENLSQGERQLLTLARAMASCPDMMILDEATSNVDTHTEALIQKAMAKLMEGRTSFVIAHRLSTIRDADQILYMEDGDILEVGNHQELMAQGGKYAALYQSQFS